MKRTIKFDSKEFELINFTRASDRVSISLKKENNTVDSIADAADGNSKIQIWEDDGTNKVLTEEYKGFDNLLAIYLMKHSPEYGEYVSLELLCNDLEAQIKNLSEMVNNINSAQTTQAEAINEIKGVQDVQDAAINDIAEVVSNIVTAEDNNKEA